MCAGCTVQEGKRIDGEDGEELLKIREAKHRNPRRMLKREKKKEKEKSVLFFFFKGRNMFKVWGGGNKPEYKAIKL